MKFFAKTIQLMQVWGIGAIVLTAVIIASVRVVDLVQAETDPPPSTEKDIYAGVWRGGKAVFSDVKALDYWWLYARGYKPVQPIAFSHRVHVQDNKMECQYCHSGVAKSPFATVPSVELCMGCHTHIGKDLKEIKKLSQYWEKKQPIEWEAVNHLPEHVLFHHERHVKAGVGCQTCHGQVQQMDVVEKVSSLKMGWCVSCHRENGASIDCVTCHK